VARSSTNPSKSAPRVWRSASPGIFAVKTDREGKADGHCWRDLDGLIDWIIQKNRAGYQMVNSVQRLEEMKTSVRMSSGLNIRQVGWFGDGHGSHAETAEMLKKAAGIVQAEDGELSFGE
jgi:hypothetical protein